MKQGKSLTELATDFERAGGQIIDLPATEWREIALAA